MTANEAATRWGIPQADPGAGYLAARDEIDAAITRVLARGQYILGGEVAAFEREFGAFLGGSECVGVGSGTDAIELALRALGVGAGDAVVAPSHAGSAPIAAIIRAGAVPVFADVVEAGYTLDPLSVAEALRAVSASEPGLRVKAVLAVHLYGEPANAPRLLELARESGAFLVEDCAQAHGGTLAGRRLGTLGDAAAFSFYPTKNLAAFGDGGLVATKDRSIADRIRRLREYGWERRHVSSIPGGVNSRLDEIQAAVLRVKLKTLEAENARRRVLASIYDAALRDVPGIAVPPGRREDHAFHQYVISVERRDALRIHLESLGVGTAVHYPVPAHQQPGFGDLIRTPVSLTRTERVCERIVSLPMFAQLDESAARTVAAEIREWALRPNGGSPGAQD